MLPPVRALQGVAAGVVSLRSSPHQLPLPTSQASALSAVPRTIVSTTMSSSEQEHPKMYAPPRPLPDGMKAYEVGGYVTERVL